MFLPVIDHSVPDSFGQACKERRAVRPGTHKGQYISLKPKGGKTRQERSNLAYYQKGKKPRSFQWTDYAKWMSMTRCVNR